VDPLGIPVTAAHGSMTGTPAAWNGAASREATGKPRAAAIAAMSPSAMVNASPATFAFDISSA
jgi:hypothetical protein